MQCRYAQAALIKPNLGWKYANDVLDTVDVPDKSKALHWTVMFIVFFILGLCSL